MSLRVSRAGALHRSTHLPNTTAPRIQPGAAAAAEPTPAAAPAADAAAAAEPEEEKDNDYSDTDEDEVRVCVCQSTVEGREGQELPLLIIAHQISLDLYIPNPEYINVLATTSNVHTNTRDVKDEMGEMEEFVPIMKPKGRKTSVMAGVVTVEAGRNNRT